MLLSGICSANCRCLLKCSDDPRGYGNENLSCAGKVREWDYPSLYSFCADFQVNHRPDSASSVAKSCPGLLFLHDPDGDIFKKGCPVLLVLVLTNIGTHRGWIFSPCASASFTNSAKFKRKKYVASEVVSFSTYYDVCVFLDTFFLAFFVPGFGDRIVSWISAFLCEMFGLIWRSSQDCLLRVRCHLPAIEANSIYHNRCQVVDSRPAIDIRNCLSGFPSCGEGYFLKENQAVEMFISWFMMSISFLFASAYRNCGVFLTSSMFHHIKFPAALSDRLASLLHRQNFLYVAIRGFVSSNQSENGIRWLPWTHFEGKECGQPCCWRAAELKPRRYPALA